MKSMWRTQSATCPFVCEIHSILLGKLVLCHFRCCSMEEHYYHHLEQLPCEIVHYLLGFMNCKDLGRIAQLNKTWQHLSDDPLLWQTLCSVTWNMPPGIKITLDTSDHWRYLLRDLQCMCALSRKASVYWCSTSVDDILNELDTSKLKDERLKVDESNLRVTFTGSIGGDRVRID